MTSAVLYIAASKLPHRPKSRRNAESDLRWITPSADLLKSTCHETVPSLSWRPDKRDEVVDIIMRSWNRPLLPNKFWQPMTTFVVVLFFCFFAESFAFRNWRKEKWSSHYSLSDSVWRRARPFISESTMHSPATRNGEEKLGKVKRGNKKRE